MVLITKASVMSLLAFLLVFVGGAVFFYDSEPGMQAVIVAAFLVLSVVQVIGAEWERRDRNHKA
jgi:hypothetical protein